MTYSINDLVKYKRRKERTIWATLFPSCPFTVEGEQLKLVRTGGGMLYRFTKDNIPSRTTKFSDFDQEQVEIWDFDLFSVYSSKYPSGDRMTFYLNVRRVILPGNNETKKRVNPRAYMIYIHDMVKVKNIDSNDSVPNLDGTPSEYTTISKIIYFPPLCYPRNHIIRFFRCIIQKKFGYRPKVVGRLRFYSVPEWMEQEWGLDKDRDKQRKEIIICHADLINVLDKISEYKDRVTKAKDVDRQLPPYDIGNARIKFFERGEYEVCKITQRDVDLYVKEENGRKHKVLK